MKTTVEISDSLMAEARALAKREGITLRVLLEAGLHRELSERERNLKKEPYKLPDRRKGGGVKPGIDLSDWRTIREIIYEPRHLS